MYRPDDSHLCPDEDAVDEQPGHHWLYTLMYYPFLGADSCSVKTCDTIELAMKEGRVPWHKKREKRWLSSLVVP